MILYSFKFTNPDVNYCRFWHREAEKIFILLFLQYDLLSNIWRILEWNGYTERQAVFDNHWRHQIDVKNILIIDDIRIGLTDEGKLWSALCQVRTFINLKFFFQHLNRYQCRPIFEAVLSVPHISYILSFCNKLLIPLVSFRGTFHGATFNVSILNASENRVINHLDLQLEII